MPSNVISPEFGPGTFSRFVNMDNPQSSVEATSRLVNRLAEHRARLYAFIRTCVYSREDAEEILQETTLALLRKLEQSDRAENFLAWAYAVARLEILRFRDRQHSGRLLVNQELVEQVLAMTSDRSELLDARHVALEDCLKKLSERDRALIHERYTQEKTPLEIASGWGKTASLVYKSMERIRQSLFECIEGRLQAERFR
jgi:RNA polymerase sigma-70 factor, ECF subfamily